MHSKIKTIAELSQIVANSKLSGTVVHCHGVFDLMHPGHIKHLEAAKREGDYLIVTITKDEYVDKGAGRPVFNQQVRAETLASLECVDYVAVNEWPTSVETIRRIKPDIYCKGSDYSKLGDEAIKAEKEAIESVGGRIHFTDEPVYSSTHLLNNHFDIYPNGAKEFLAEFRKKYTSEEIIARLEGLKSLKVLVIGDTIIDQYNYCSSIGKSPKDNVMVVRYLSEEKFAGGVLAVANHVAGFCDDVTLVTCLGYSHTQEGYIRSHLKKNIKPKFFYRDDVATIVKLRYVEPTRLTKMFGVSYLEDYPLPETVSKEVCEHLCKDVNKYDLLLVADYGHGFIDGGIRKTFNDARFIAVNMQTNTDNFGFNLITNYSLAHYTCIDEPETRLAFQDKYGSLDYMAEMIGNKVAITHGQYDTLMYDGEFHKIPIFSKEVRDTTGAGDAFLAITSPCVAAGFPMDMVGFIGNAVGALKVRTVCNRSSIDKKELYRLITTLLK